jgi:hypothetical protein
LCVTLFLNETHAEPMAMSHSTKNKDFNIIQSICDHKTASPRSLDYKQRVVNFYERMELGEDIAVQSKGWDNSFFPKLRTNVEFFPILSIARHSLQIRINLTIEIITLHTSTIIASVTKF